MVIGGSIKTLWRVGCEVNSTNVRSMYVQMLVMTAPTIMMTIIITRSAMRKIYKQNGVVASSKSVNVWITEFNWNLVLAD